jgi:hypothetical protein
MSNKHTFSIICAFVVLGSFSGAYGGYAIIDQTYNIYATHDAVVIYNQSSSSPIDSTFHGDIVTSSGSTNVDSWYGFDVFKTFASASNLLYEGEFTFDIRTSISTTFRPNGNSFEIHKTLYDEWWGCRSYVQLTDQTEDITVFYADWFGGNMDGIYSMNPGHIYNLYVYSGITLTNTDSLSSLAEVYFTVTPEPTTLSLVALGAMVLKRKRK